MCSIVDVEVVVTIHVQAGELGVVLVITCTVVIRIISVAFLTIINIIVIINIINVNIIIINTRQKLAYGRQGLTNVSLCASGAQLGSDYFCDIQTLHHNIYIINILIITLDHLPPPPRHLSPYCKRKGHLQCWHHPPFSPISSSPSFKMMKKYCSGHFGKMLWETLNFRARALKDCDSLNKCWREALKNSARSQNQIERASDQNQDVKASSKKNQFHCPSFPSPSDPLKGFAKSRPIQAPIVILRYTIPHKKPLEEAVKIRFQNVRFAKRESCRVFRTILWISRKYLDSLSSSSVEINRG